MKECTVGQAKDGDASQPGMITAYLIVGFTCILAFGVSLCLICMIIRGHAEEKANKKRDEMKTESPGQRPQLHSECIPGTSYRRSC